MKELELESSYFYNTILEFIEKGITENRYFYNNTIFKSNDENIINDEMKEYIFKACSNMLLNSNDKRLYYRFTGNSYTDNSRIYVVKQIVREVTLSYYKDKLKNTGLIDANMDVHNLNVSNNTIEFLKKELSIPNDIVRLIDLIDINRKDLERFKYNGGSNKNELNDLVSFCEDVYNILLNNSKNNDTVNQINILEETYYNVTNKIIQLEKQQQYILNEIKALKGQLFEDNSINSNISFQRKR